MSKVVYTPEKPRYIVEEMNNGAEIGWHAYVGVTTYPEAVARADELTLDYPDWDYRVIDTHEEGNDE